MEDKNYDYFVDRLAELIVEYHIKNRKKEDSEEKAIDKSD